MLLRLAYLSLTNIFAEFRLPPMTDRDRDVEILALRHQIGVPQRQLGGARVRFTPADRAEQHTPNTHEITERPNVDGGSTPGG